LLPHIRRMMNDETATSMRKSGRYHDKNSSQCCGSELHFEYGEQGEKCIM
jgi:hypothetical protein